MSATLATRNHDEFIELRKAPGFVPGRPHKATIFRWIQSGVNSPGGERIKLKATRIGGRIFLRLTDLETFLSRLNERDHEQGESEESDDTRRSREAREALRGLGV